jgi:hypothetical protein
MKLLATGPGHTSSGWSLNSDRGGPGSPPVRSCEIWCEQIGTGAGFLRALRFPLPIKVPPNPPSSSSPGVGTIG